jgi:hypothetical protein
MLGEMDLSLSDWASTLDSRPERVKCTPLVPRSPTRTSLASMAAVREDGPAMTWPALDEAQLVFAALYQSTRRQPAGFASECAVKARMPLTHACRRGELLGDPRFV